MAHLLELTEIIKTFPNGTIALKGVDFRVDRGSVHGLVGANGAGKSTLFKIVAGAIKPSTGTISWKGQPVQWGSPAAPRAAGISTIYQHIPLVPTVSVLENVFLGESGLLMNRPRWLGRYDQLLERIGYRLDPDLLVGELSIGQRQMVAILHAMASGAELVMMDEPTASLSQGERELVFSTVRRLSEKDATTFIYCSHFLDEVLSLTDTVTALRDGRVVLRLPTAEVSEDALVEAMVGRKLMHMEDSRVAPIPDEVPVALDVRELRSPARIGGVSFRLRTGEILGLAGLLGSGRSEILHAIFGSDRRATGAVTLAGRTLQRSPQASVRAGLALVPEDRVRQGLVTDWEIWRNTSLPDLDRLSRRAWLPQLARELDRARRAIKELKIVASGPHEPVSSLSGGNAQKVVFAKWLYGRVQVFLLDEPTVGVDVGTKADILELIRHFAQAGKSVLMVSSEFEELLAVCHRILVVRHGNIVAERNSSDTSEEELVSLASGLQPAAAPEL